MPIKLIIVDDHALLIKGLEDTLAAFDNIEILKTFRTAAQLLGALPQMKPDVLLLDIHLPDNNGGELVRKILKEYPSLRILILTSLESLDSVKAMIQYGCMGYLYKSTADEFKLREAIETVHKGNIYIEPSIQQSYMRSLLKRKADEDGAPQLTRREQEILRLIAEGHTSTEIASRLHLSHRTIEGYRHTIMQKLEVKNTASLIKAAIQMGIIV